MNRLKFFFILLLIPFFSFTVHKYYISLIKIEYKPEKENVKITMRVFIDDLEKVINETNKISIELAVKDEVKNADNLIKKYIKNNFKLAINSKVCAYEYLGKAYENDIVYVYLEINNIKAIKSIDITDTMLMDYFPTQKNIVKLSINDVKKTLLLTAEENKGILNF